MLRFLLCAFLVLCAGQLAAQTFKEHYNLGVQYFQAGNYPQAIAYLNKAIALNDADPDAFYNRGVAKLISNDYTGALKDFNAAIKLNGNFTDAYYNRGQASARLNDPVAVIQDMTQVLKRDREYTDAYAMRGQNYFYLDNYVDGCRDLKSAYEMGFRKADSQIKLYCNVPLYFTEVPLTEDFLLDWTAMGTWKETGSYEYIDEQQVEKQGSGAADGLLARQLFLRNFVNCPMEQARERIQQREVGNDKAKVKVLAEGKDGNYDYSMFTLQPGSSKQLQLWYLYQGERGLYANAIVFQEGKPSKSALETWSQFLQLGELEIKQVKRQRAGSK